MKLRCPHCKHVFEQLDQSCCPSCSKALRLPPSLLPGAEKDRRRSSRSDRAVTAPASGGSLYSLLELFSQRPRFTLWAIGLTVIVVLSLTTVKVNTGLPRAITGKPDRTLRELRVLRTALEWFRVSCKRYPTTEEGLKALVINPGIPGWEGFYIQELPCDLWGHPFEYSRTNDEVRLLSLGPDGIVGTADDIPAPDPDYKALMKRLAATNLQVRSAAPR